MAGTRFELEEEVDNILIGCDSSCGFVLDTPGVSPIHARLWVDLKRRDRLRHQQPARSLRQRRPRGEGSSRSATATSCGSGRPATDRSVMIQCRLPSLQAEVEPTPMTEVTGPVDVQETQVLSGAAYGAAAPDFADSVEESERYVVADRSEREERAVVEEWRRAPSNDEPKTLSSKLGGAGGAPHPPHFEVDIEDTSAGRPVLASRAAMPPPPEPDYEGETVFTPPVFATPEPVPPRVEERTPIAAPTPVSVAARPAPTPVPRDPTPRPSRDASGRRRHRCPPRPRSPGPARRAGSPASAWPWSPCSRSAGCWRSGSSAASRLRSRQCPRPRPRRPCPDDTRARARDGGLAGARSAARAPAVGSCARGRGSDDRQVAASDAAQRRAGRFGSAGVSVAARFGSRLTGAAVRATGRDGRSRGPGSTRPGSRPGRLAADAGRQRPRCRQRRSRGRPFRRGPEARAAECPRPRWQDARAVGLEHGAPRVHGRTHGGEDPGRRKYMAGFDTADVSLKKAPDFWAGSTSRSARVRSTRLRPTR